MYTKKYKKSLKYRKATFKAETKRLISNVGPLAIWKK